MMDRRVPLVAAVAWVLIAPSATALAAPAIPATDAAPNDPLPEKLRTWTEPPSLRPDTVPADATLREALSRTYERLGLDVDVPAAPGSDLPPLVRLAVADLLVASDRAATDGDAEALVRASARARRLTADVDADFHWSDPTGLIQVGGTGPNTYEGNDVEELLPLPEQVGFDDKATLLTLDLGGNDTYRNRAGAAHPVAYTPSEAVAGYQHDLGHAFLKVQHGVHTQNASRIRDGAETAVDASEAFARETLRDPDPNKAGEIEAGVAVSLSVDLTGDDRYESGTVSQGVGIFGTGVLVDFAGDDRYKAEHVAQGAASQGVGMLVDAAGDDRYRLNSTGQGLAGSDGLGRLVDLDGDDIYRARGGAQGVGISPSARVGHLLDVAGDDRYELEFAGQGLGIGGPGLLSDLDGDDAYNPTEVPDPRDLDPANVSANPVALLDGMLTQGATILAGTGTLYDANGEDRYGAAIFAQGVTLAGGDARLVDAAGHDRYEAGALAQAHALVGGTARLTDGDGDDVYVCLFACQSSALKLVQLTPESRLRDTGGDDDYLCVAFCQAAAAGRQPRDPGMGGQAPESEGDRGAQPQPPSDEDDEGADEAVARLVETEGDDTYFAHMFAQGLGGFEYQGVDWPHGRALFAEAQGDDRYSGSPGQDGSCWTQGGGRGVDVARSDPGAATCVVDALREEVAPDPPVDAL